MSSALNHSFGSWPEHFHVEKTERADGTIVLAVAGEADIASAPILQAALTEAVCRRGPDIVLDLSGLEFIDSSGIGVLVRAQQRATNEGRRLVLANVPPQTAHVLSVAGLASRFTIAQGTSLNGHRPGPPSHR